MPTHPSGPARRTPGMAGDRRPGRRWDRRHTRSHLWSDHTCESIHMHRRTGTAHRSLQEETPVSTNASRTPTKAKAAAETVVAPDAAAEVDALVQRGLKALAAYADFTQEQVDHIVKKASVAALHEHGNLAKLAVEETGRGIF